jgi:hypothetical protein
MKRCPCGSRSTWAAGGGGEVRARAGAGAARVAGEAGDADEAAREAVSALAAAGGGGEVRARAGAGAARVVGEAGEADEAACEAVSALAAAGGGGEVRARAGAGAARVVGEAGEAGEAVREAVRALAAEENYPAVAGRGLQGRAQPGRASAMEAEGGSQGMGCQGRRSGHSYAGQFQQTCHASYPSGSLFLRKPHCSNQRLNLLRYSLSHLGKKVNGIVGRDLARGRC